MTLLEDSVSLLFFSLCRVDVARNVSGNPVHRTEIRNFLIFEFPFMGSLTMNAHACIDLSKTDRKSAQKLCHITLFMSHINMPNANGVFWRL